MKSFRSGIYGLSKKLASIVSITWEPGINNTNSVYFSPFYHTWLPALTKPLPENQNYDKNFYTFEIQTFSFITPISPTLLLIFHSMQSWRKFDVISRVTPYDHFWSDMFEFHLWKFLKCSLPRSEVLHMFKFHI